jgi:beta-N-acetylhexosaminidase
MSKVFIQDILRKQLGFEGLVITDEVEMYGFKVHPTLEEDIMTSFNAGVDIFVIGHTYDIQKSVIDILTEGFKTGEISMDRLDESVLRILKIKNKYNLDQWSNTTFEENKKLFGSTENQQVLEEINQRMQKLQ